MKNYFKLNLPYHFEWNDWVGPANMLNLFLVIKFGLIASWFGLAINLACIVYDIITIKRINLIILHLSIVLMNAYFLNQFYHIL